MKIQCLLLLAVLTSNCKTPDSGSSVKRIETGPLPGPAGAGDSEVSALTTCDRFFDIAPKVKVRTLKLIKNSLHIVNKEAKFSPYIFTADSACIPGDVETDKILLKIAGITARIDRDDAWLDGGIYEVLRCSATTLGNYDHVLTKFEIHVKNTDGEGSLIEMVPVSGRTNIACFRSALAEYFEFISP